MDQSIEFRRSKRSAAMKAQNKMISDLTDNQYDSNEEPKENLDSLSFVNSNFNVVNEKVEFDSFLKTSSANRNRAGKKGEEIFCIGCSEFKDYYMKNMCRKCYEREIYKERKLNENKKGVCIDCGKIKLLHWKQKCDSCYSRQRYYNRKVENKKKICVHCSKLKIIRSNGMCATCYQKEMNKKHRLEGTNMTIYVEYGEFKTNCGKGYCKLCYDRKWKKVEKICTRCRELKPYSAKGLCKSCYNQKRRENEENKRECRECKKVKFIDSCEMCSACYARIFVASKRKEKKMIINHKPKFIAKIELPSDSEDDWEISVELSSGDEDRKTIKFELKCEPSTSSLK